MKGIVKFRKQNGGNSKGNVVSLAGYATKMMQIKRNRAKIVADVVRGVRK